MAAQFSWAAASDVGMGIAGAISAWGTASANKIITSANIDAQNTVRKAQNEQRAGNLSLAATMRGISYRATLTNAGDEYGNATEMLARSQQAWTSNSLEQNLHNAQQFGAVAARSAAAGVGGASVRATSYSMQLQQDRMDQLQTERQGQQTYEMVKQRAGIMPAAGSRLDVSPLNPNLDYSQSFAPIGNSSNLLGALATGILSKSKSLQVALDSIPTSTTPDPAQLTTGDFSRMDRAWHPEAQVIQID